ncbi:hypothetical protein ACF1AL_14935 [Streptomyces sp. NPDC014801]|uniref:hypothetical protein n=1 Tax=Streptomyces sp. NPDC014801 TaxID=3364916 RepID=UPI0036F5B35C
MGSHALGINASGGSPAYNAQQFRQSMSALMLPGANGLQVVQGVRPGSGLGVSVAGSTITVTPGSAIVQGASSTVQGPYLAVLDANWTQTLTAADGTNPRIDLVYLRVWDTDADGTGQRNCLPVYVVGTPAASPTAPTIPAGVTGVPLATISVPKSGAGSPTVSTTVRPYTVAAGGIAVGPTAPPNPYTGQYWDDGSSLRRWTGGVWETYGPQPSWQSYTPTWTGLSNAGSGFQSLGRWIKLNPTTVIVKATLIAGTSPSLGLNQIQVSLPIASSTAPPSGMDWLGHGHHSPANGQAWTPLVASLQRGSSTAIVYGVRTSDLGFVDPGDAGYTFVAGSSMHIEIEYETA